MANLTIKQLDPTILRRLRAQAKKRKMSMNALIKELLATTVGYEAGSPTFRDLSHLAGSWTLEELSAFEQGTRPFSEIDPGLWR